jgi:DNA gyrase subunit A
MEKITEIIRAESQAILENFGRDRLTQISDAEMDIDMDDLIAREDMVVTITNTGYIKRVALDTYRAQRRGGKGRNAMTTKDEDYVTDVFIANTHTPLMFFSSAGMCYRLKTYKLPEGGAAAKGRPLVNLLPLSAGETVTAVLPEDSESEYLMFATRNGNVRRNKTTDFSLIRANGKIAMKLDDGDSLIAVKNVSENQDILLSTYRGKAIRFAVPEIRVFAGRASDGIRAIKLAGDDRVIDMAVLQHMDEDSDDRIAYVKQSRMERRAATGIEEESDDAGEEATNVVLSPEKYAEMKAAEQFILTVSENGFGKRTSSYEYRTTHRGGNGFAGIKLGGRNTAVAAAMPISDDMDLLLVTDGGKIIRTPAGSIRIAGRATAGVTLFRTADDEKVISATMIEHEEIGKENDGDTNA